MGALEVGKVIHRHQVWRLFSCIWLHGGVVHLLANMLSLVFIGIRLEQEFGFGTVLVIILALSIISSFTHFPFPSPKLFTLLRVYCINICSGRNLADFSTTISVSDCNFYVGLSFGSSNWISVCDIRFWRQFAVCSIHTRGNLGWCFWCIIWLTGRHVIGALDKLDNICQ